MIISKAKKYKNFKEIRKFYNKEGWVSLKNYIKIAFRNLLKNKSQTLINVGGLTLGIVCAIVIFLIIQFDLSFDKWHEDSDRIYRVVRHETEFGKSVYYRGGPYPLAEAIRNDVREWQSC